MNSSLQVFRSVTLPKGARKIKDPCGGCGLNKSLCICEQIPRLSLKTKLTLLIHYREAQKPSNTGKLALRALSNSNVFLRGLPQQPLQFGEILDSAYTPLLFYPSLDALELTENLVQGLGKPVQLLVPDGSWRQAGKISTRHVELKNILRVKISEPNLSLQHLRKEHLPEGMSTLEAIAKAYGVLEGLNVRDELLALYDLKLKTTLRARGHIVSY